MEILTLPSGPLQTNTFLIDNGKGQALVIDAPPGGYDNVMPLVKERNLTLHAVLITHGHFDHVLDACRYKEAGVPLLIHKESQDLLEDPARWIPFSLPGITLKGVVPDENDFILEGEKELEWGGISLKALPAPGHCPGSLVFYLEMATSAFVGDVIFYRSVGRTDLVGGNEAILAQSIRDVIFTLPKETLLYPGHGQSTLVEEEQNHNPYVL